MGDVWCAGLCSDARASAFASSRSERNWRGPMTPMACCCPMQPITAHGRLATGWNLQCLCSSLVSGIEDGGVGWARDDAVWELGWGRQRSAHEAKSEEFKENSPRPASCTFLVLARRSLRWMQQARTFDSRTGDEEFTAWLPTSFPALQRIVAMTSTEAPNPWGSGRTSFARLTPRRTSSLHPVCQSTAKTAGQRDSGTTAACEDERGNSSDLISSTVACALAPRCRRHDTLSPPVTAISPQRHPSQPL